METGEVAGRVREICPYCRFVMYRNPVPGAGVLIEMGRGVVLIQRGQAPFVGSWALPSGYIEEDESVEQAAIRECKEETGYLLNKLGSCGRSPDRATAGTVRRPARASLPRFIEMIRNRARHQDTGVVRCILIPRGRFAPQRHRDLLPGQAYWRRNAGR